MQISKMGVFFGKQKNFLIEGRGKHCLRFLKMTDDTNPFIKPIFNRSYFPQCIINETKSILFYEPENWNGNLSPK